MSKRQCNSGCGGGGTELEQYEKIIADLRILSGPEKNHYLDKIEFDRLYLKYVIEKEMLDNQYESKKLSIQLRKLRDDYKLFEYDTN